MPLSSPLPDSSLTDRVTLPTSAVRQWSVNHFKTWSRCQRKFELDIVQGLRWPSDPRNFELGQDVHKLMDYQARSFSCEAMVTAASPGVQNAWRALMACPAAHWPVIASEWGFLAPLETTPPCWLTGRIDRIARDPNTRRIWVIDWKTGTAAPRDPTRDWQTVAYLFAAYEGREALGLEANLRPEQFGFLYVEARGERLRQIEIPYDAQMRLAHTARLHETAHAMNAAQIFALPPECPDRHCPYSPICGIRQSASAASPFW